MAITAQANDICEIVVKYWQDTGRISEKLYDMNTDLISEIIDGIDAKEYPDLIDALKGAFC